MITYKDIYSDKCFAIHEFLEEGLRLGVFSSIPGRDTPFAIVRINCNSKVLMYPAVMYSVDKVSNKFTVKEHGKYILPFKTLDEVIHLLDQATQEFCLFHIDLFIE